MVLKKYTKIFINNKEDSIESQSAQIITNNNKLYKQLNLMLAGFDHSYQFFSQAK